MLHRQYGDEGEDGQGNDDDDEEEKVLPEFTEGDQYGLFFSASKKVRAHTLDMSSTRSRQGSSLPCFRSPTRSPSVQPAANFVRWT